VKILITGGAGFIGSHLAERHLAAGDEVRVLDNLSTGRPENISGFAGHPAFQFTKGSITDEAALRSSMNGCAVVYHLAAAVGVRWIIESPVWTIETNVLGTDTVLRCCAELGAKVIIASTSEVYGKGVRVPFTEDDDLLLGPTTRPRWSYACSKAIDEFLGLAYAAERGVAVVVARLFNTIGPRQVGRYGMVVPSFVSQALLGTPITVFGTGEQSRSFTDVRDVVHVLQLLASSEKSSGEVFNVGSENEISILQLAERIRNLTGSNSEILKIPYSEAYAPGFEDIQRRRPSIAKLEAMTAYRPKYSLDETLATVIEYARGLSRPDLEQLAAPPAPAR
jgi:UDP-glucose 4-epimerase